MSREDILRKSRDENGFLDEREREELGRSFGFGGGIVCLLCVVFAVARGLQGRSFYEFGAIIFGYLAGIMWRSYQITQKKAFFIQGVACGFVAVLGLVAFFWLG